MRSVDAQPRRGTCGLMEVGQSSRDDRQDESQSGSSDYPRQSWRSLGLIGNCLPLGVEKRKQPLAVLLPVELIFTHNIELGSNLGGVFVQPLQFN